MTACRKIVFGNIGRLGNQHLTSNIKLVYVESQRCRQNDVISYVDPTENNQKSIKKRLINENSSWTNDIFNVLSKLSPRRRQR